MKNITFFFILFSSMVLAQNPTDSVVSSEVFPDPSFRQYLFNTIDYNQDQRIQLEEIQGTTKLELKNQPIESLEGIALFVNLDTLLIEAARKVKNIDLSANHKIVHLDIYWCSALVDLKVSKLAPIVFLSAHDNSLTSFDASGLSQLQKLLLGAQKITHLDIRATQLTYLNAFENPKMEVCVDSYEQWNAIAYNDLRSCPDPQPSWCSYELTCIEQITSLIRTNVDSKLPYVDYDLLGNKVDEHSYQGIVIRYYESGLRQKIYIRPSY